MEKKMTQRAAQAVQRRKELLASAKKLFAEQGYHATTTRSINQQIGMADGLMYHYFPGGKQEILETIIAEEFQPKVEQVELGLQAIDENTTPEEALMAVGRLILTHAVQERELLTILMRENHILDDSFHAPPILQMIHHVKAKLIAVLQRGIDSKQLKPLHPEMMVVQFLSSFSFFILQKSIFGEKSAFSMDADTFLKKIIQHTLQTWKA